MPDAINRIKQATATGEAVAVAFHGNAFYALQWMLDNGVSPDIMTDQTAAHDPLNGYFPYMLDFESALRLRRERLGGGRGGFHDACEHRCEAI